MDKIQNFEDVYILDEMLQNVHQMIEKYPRECYEKLCIIVDIANEALKENMLDDSEKRVICLLNANAYISLSSLLHNHFDDKVAAQRAFLTSQYMMDKVETFIEKEKINE